MSSVSSETPRAIVALWHFEASGSQSSPPWSVQSAGIWNCRCHDSGSFCLVLELSRLDTMSSTDLKVQKAGDWESYPRTSSYRYPTWLAWKLARIYLHQELSCQNLLCICDRTWASIPIFWSCSRCDHLSFDPEIKISSSVFSSPERHTKSQILTLGKPWEQPWSCKTWT